MEQKFLANFKHAWCDHLCFWRLPLNRISVYKGCYNFEIMRKKILFFIAIICVSPGLAYSKNITSSSNDAPFSVIMSADTQYARIIDPNNPGSTKPYQENSCGTGSTPTDKECQKASAKDIGDYFNSMASLKKESEGRDIAGVFINGDLTEFGHDSELDGFTSLLRDGVSAMSAATSAYSSTEPPVGFFMGLGNHDYANNVNDCYANNCAVNMVSFMQRKDWPGIIKSYIANVDNNPVANGSSLAYSVDINNVHFVILNNYPTYANSWAGVAGNKYIILSSLNWLALDLDKARKANKFIIIAFHDPSEHFILDNNARRFKRLIEQFKVSAIFVGHFHWMNGENIYANKDIYGDVPVIQSGSAIYGQYTLVKFDTADKKMFLSVYDAANGQATPATPYYPLKASYDLKQ